MIKVTYYKMYCRLSKVFFSIFPHYYWDCATRGNHLALPTDYSIGQAAQLKKIFKKSVERGDLAFQKKKGFHPIGVVIKATINGTTYLGASVKNPKDNWDVATGLIYAWEDLKGSVDIENYPELINGCYSVQQKPTEKIYSKLVE